ncbi:MAG: IS1595 family transposase, partial [Cyclobacteriaceae bacterium]|nr:IS1595 family transposase [Cyclobacteriaceae bacterium]
MKMPVISLLGWQKRFGTEKACAQSLAKVRWPQGFQCPACGSMKSSFIVTRKLHQCSQCRHQVSVTFDTLFHATKIPLVKWFWAIYLTASDKGGISALRLSKQIEVSWRTARNMLKKIRTAMAHRDSIYRLQKLIEFDDTYVSGKRAGKRGRGAEGKKSVLVAVETRNKGAGFVAMKAVETVSKKTVRDFLAFHLKVGQNVRTDALPALNSVAESHVHEKKVTPPEKASQWLPLVHIMIGNMKQFINGTFHGVSSEYLQEYLDEFCYRFNRRFWEP